MTDKDRRTMGPLPTARPQKKRARSLANFEKAAVDETTIEKRRVASEILWFAFSTPNHHMATLKHECVFGQSGHMQCSISV